MDQDWTTVVLKKKSTAPTNVPKFTPTAIALRKVEESETFVKAKQLTSESKQQIVNYRIEHKLSQSDLDNRCSFPRNTIQHIESSKRPPSNSELQKLNQLLKVALKLL